MDTNTIKIGRPAAFKQEYLQQTTNLCLLGATDKDLAIAFDVSEQTINSWKRKIPGFIESIKEGKEKADGKVAQSLYNRAISGDTIACIFWLKNRKSDQWRDKIEHSGELSLKTVILAPDAKLEAERPELKPAWNVIEGE
jgi:hypothetical protein